MLENEYSRKAHRSNFALFLWQTHIYPVLWLAQKVARKFSFRTMFPSLLSCVRSHRFMYFSKSRLHILSWETAIHDANKTFIVNNCSIKKIASKDSLSYLTTLVSWNPTHIKVVAAESKCNISEVDAKGGHLTAPERFWFILALASVYFNWWSITRRFV